MNKVAKMMHIDPALVKAVILTALAALAVIVLSACGRVHDITLANGGWTSISVNGAEVERLSCDYTNQTITATGALNYTGKQKPLTYKGMTITCDNAKQQLETTFKHN